MNLLMRAVGGISDEHITEFANVKLRKKRVPLWVKIASAACLALAVTAVFVIHNLIDKTDPGNFTNTLQPCLYFNDRFYVLDPVGHGSDKLPEGYVLVGEITSEDRNNKKVNGYGEMLRIGNEIYQNPDFLGDVYVYTTLFTGGERYWFLRFTDLETFKREVEERGCCLPRKIQKIDKQNAKKQAAENEEIGGLFIYKMALLRQMFSLNAVNVEKTVTKFTHC